MQRRAAEDLRKLVTDALVDAGLVYEGAKAFATPRRLALTVHGLPARSPDVREERKGPRVGAPDSAIEGFLKGAGLTSIDEATVQPDKKGDFYVAVIEKPGRPAPRSSPSSCPGRDGPSPGRSRCAGASARPSPAPQLGASAAFDPLRLRPGDRGHRDRRLRGRRHRSGDATLRPPLHGAGSRSGCAASTTTSPSWRRPRSCSMPTGARRSSSPTPRIRRWRLGLELVEDEGLLEEVAGLVEWPVVLIGSFDEAFLEIPPEVIRTTIRANQKCFVLRDYRSTVAARSASSSWSPISRPSDGGKAIVAGNERVIRARLVRCPLLLGDRPQDVSARTAPAAPKLNATSSSTRSSARRASASSGSSGWRARSPDWSAPTPRRRSARPARQGRSASPRWSASSRSCRG